MVSPLTRLPCCSQAASPAEVPPISLDVPLATSVKVDVKADVKTDLKADATRGATSGDFAQSRSGSRRQSRNDVPLLERFTAVPASMAMDADQPLERGEARLPVPVTAISQLSSGSLRVCTAFGIAVRLAHASLTTTALRGSRREPRGPIISLALAGVCASCPLTPSRKHERAPLLSQTGDAAKEAARGAAAALRPTSLALQSPVLADDTSFMEATVVAITSPERARAPGDAAVDFGCSNNACQPTNAALTPATLPTDAAWRGQLPGRKTLPPTLLCPSGQPSAAVAPTMGSLFGGMTVAAEKLVRRESGEAVTGAASSAGVPSAVLHAAATVHGCVAAASSASDSPLTVQPWVVNARHASSEGAAKRLAAGTSDAEDEPEAAVVGSLYFGAQPTNQRFFAGHAVSPPRAAILREPGGWELEQEQLDGGVRDDPLLFLQPDDAPLQSPSSSASTDNIAF